MKRVTSVLGMGPLALLLGASVLFANLENVANTAYLALLAQQAAGSGAVAIVQSALNVVYHISMTASNPNAQGTVFTHYNPNDGRPSPYPGFNQQKLLQYWQQGGVSLYDIECAGFVSGVLDVANHPMVQPLGLAVNYWRQPGNSFPSSDWQYILPLQGGETPPGGINATRGMPLPGDIAVFSGSTYAGHVAIVVAVNPPSNGQGNGTIVLAQANFPPNYYTLDPNPPNVAKIGLWSGANPVPWITTRDIPLYVAPLSTAGNIDLGAAHTLLGYIRNLKAQASGTPSNVKLPNSPWVAVAEYYATMYGIPPTTFAKQINQESGFNPNAVSPAGALGIAQFMPATASGMGIDPMNPSQALEGAAKMMADSYHSYLNSGSSSTVAYERALANYNCGDCIRMLQNNWGSAWVTHFRTFAGGQTWDYIKIIAPWVELPGCGLAPELSSPGLLC